MSRSSHIKASYVIAKSNKDLENAEVNWQNASQWVAERLLTSEWAEHLPDLTFSALRAYLEDGTKLPEDMPSWDRDDILAVLWNRHRTVRYTLPPYMAGAMVIDKRYHDERPATLVDYYRAYFEFGTK